VKVAFLASRKGYFKVLGSLIQAAVDRGHAVVLVRDPKQRKKGEATTEDDFKHWPAARVIDHEWGSPLLPTLKEECAEALIAPSLHTLLKAMTLEGEAQEMREAGIRLYSVDYAFETVTSDPEGYRVVDVTFYQSDFQRRLHWQERKTDFATLGPGIDLEARSAVCGSTMMDQLALVTDRASVRRKYGLPPDKPVVLFMSLKMAVPEPWRTFVWGSSWRGVREALRRQPAAAVRMAGEIATGLVDRLCRGSGYRRLIESVRRFCADNGAVLVVKSREKNADPPFLARLADVFVKKDEDVFPYNSMELMAISSLCIHFQSGAVLEAAFCGAPSISIRVPQSHLAGVTAFQESFGGMLGTLQNFEGVVWSSDRREAERLLEGRTLADFGVNPDARRAYVEKYLGFGDTRSSQRVLDVIERGA
jgi:hypothetical protein